MASTSLQSVNEYISSQPETARAVLERVRNTIRKAVPEAEETISYNIPTYKLHGRPVLYFAGWKQHWSLYPIGAQMVAAFQNDLAPYEISKSTVRFPLSQPVPARLIGRIAKFRANEVTEAKDATPKKRRARSPAPARLA